MELDQALIPSPDAQTVLRANGWSPDRIADSAEWVATLRREGNDVFPVADAILKKFGGLHITSGEPPQGSRHALDIDPRLWYQERDQIRAVEEATGCRVCPLGEVYGGAMLAVLDDGRIISDLSGDIAVLGQDLRAALDLLVLGRGTFAMLARNYAPISGHGTASS